MPLKVLVVTPPGTAKLIEPFVDSIRNSGLTVDAHAGAVDEIYQQDVWREAQVLIGAGFACGPAEMDCASNLQAIVTLTIGYEGVDIAAASERNILVVNGQAPENYESMAEATILLILAALYDLPGAQRRLATGQWHVSPLGSRMLKGKSVGIIGYGNIARNVVDRLRGWGVTLLVHTRRPPSDPDEGITFVSLEQLIACSDVIVPLASLNDSSAHLLTADRLASVRQGAVLINTARGGLLDEQALVRLVQDGHIGAVALDVYETEPLPLDSPLLTLPHAILTPHDLGHTRESNIGMVKLGLQHLLEIERGMVPACAVNAEAVPNWSFKAS